jgi:hypothetical protein
VYSISGDTGSLPAGGDHIKYAGLRKAADSSESAVSLDTQYPNGRLLTFNSNEEKTNDTEIGRLTGGRGETIPKFPSTGTGRSAWQAGDSWVIDARDIIGRPDNGGN